MGKRLLIVSTLDSSQPFGAFTRPFYLGKYLVEYFDVFHVGINCSAINYAPSVSVGCRSLNVYIQKIKKCIDELQPEIIYAQETLPAIASLIAFNLKKPKKCSLVFDFHTFSAFEYWTRLSSVANPFNEFLQLIKTYIAQGILVFSGHPIITAGNSIPKLISQWYGKKASNIYSVGNGVAEDFLETNLALIPKLDPYQHLRPAKIVVVVAPKTFQFPSNDMSVAMTIEIAQHLESHAEHVHFIVIGRDREGLENLPKNICFLGFLPSREDFVKHLRFADIGLLPFPKQAVAGGARNKALDYFAARTLVTSTPEGLRGLEDFHHLQHLLIPGFSVELVADAILESALNLEKYEYLVEAAYDKIRGQYSWAAKAEEIQCILNL